MLDSALLASAMHTLPILQNAPNPFVNEFSTVAFYGHFASGHDIFSEGDEIDTIALLLSGVVRVYKIAETGREITLYRFGTGEACILTANAILSRQTFPAIATVEEDTEALLIPAEVFRVWVAKYPVCRDFVFSLLAQRLSIVMEVVNEVAFRRMDARVAAWILQHGQSYSVLHTTHQALAAELGSSREVVSRILEEFAAQGAVHLTRGAIHIQNAAWLREYTAM